MDNILKQVVDRVNEIMDTICEQRKSSNKEFRSDLFMDDLGALAVVEMHISSCVFDDYLSIFFDNEEQRDKFKKDYFYLIRGIIGIIKDYPKSMLNIEFYINEDIFCIETKGSKYLTDELLDEVRRNGWYLVYKTIKEEIKEVLEEEMKYLMREKITEIEGISITHEYGFADIETEDLMSFPFDFVDI